MRVAAFMRSPKGSPVARLSPPPAIWRAFERQGAWKSWAMVVLLGLLTLESIAIIRLANRPPEFVVVDDSSGKATYVRRAVATEALLQFLADRTKPPELAIVRFTRDFLTLALALNSATIEANWPAALALMSPDLRGKVEKEASEGKVVETYKLAQQKTDLHFDDLTLVTRTPSLLHVRATLTRTRRSLADSSAPAVDRVAVDLAERIVPPRLDRPDGLEVVEWNVERLDNGNGAAEGRGREESHGE
jgi:hypothetical protein